MTVAEMTPDTAERTPALAPASNPFEVSHEDWVTIQVYVENALHLPITDDAMAKMLQTDLDTAKSLYGQLTAIYAGMAEHGATWKNATFPFTVHLASDLVHYASKAGVFYGALNQLLPGLQAGDSGAKAHFLEIVDSLLASATAMRDDAVKAQQMVARFSDDTDSDAAQLAAEKNRLDTEFNLEARVGELRKQIEDLHSMIAEMQKEYNQAVVVAATSATYGWIVPFGTIAAAIVAGLFGSEAGALKKGMDAAKGQLEDAEKELATDSNLVALLALADTSMGQIQDSLRKAAPVIEELKGIWSALADDLGFLRTIIEEDIEKAQPIIAGLGIEEAIGEWKKIGAEADSYRVNAFVTIDVNG